MSDTPKDAKGIFLAALDIGDAAERAAFVQRSCGEDAALRQRVEDLLRAYGQSEGPLDKLAAALAPTALAEPIREQVGATIGPYKLMEQIGEGGFGLVFVAEQQQPIRRKVALKIIKPGMDTRDVIARFEAERQALALMDHPNIARVLDAGTTESGRPYFVMELVRGIPITDYCDKNQLTPRERLELFIPVCNAIQHAHLKGIIHRDIKPSNVLVTLHDGKPVVKVIDFGVAKALHQSLTDRTVYTRFAQMIGTPLYMSPEQAEMSGLDIDTRTDVYSLGVLLYELLTGTTPLDKKRLAQAAYDELLKIIREEDPPKPSVRLSQSTDSLPSIAALRKTEPAKLSKMFHGDVDWIAMKALEKDRTRRYETANAFAADVLRYLNDEPVEASPPSTVYRIRKFARKNRAALVTSCSFAALLIVATVVSAWLAIREKSARAVAEIETSRADRGAFQAEQRGREAEKARADAEANAQQAKAEAARANWLLYGREIAEAKHDWEVGHVGDAWRHLDSSQRSFRGWEYQYLRTLFNDAQQTLRAHTSAVVSVAFSPDGTRVFSGSHDSTIKVWDAGTGRAMLTLKGAVDPSSFQNVAFSPDCRRIVTGKQDDRTTTSTVLGFRVVDTIGLSTGSMTVWDATSGQKVFSQRVESPLAGLAFSPDGKRIVGGCHDNIKVWDATSGQETLTLKGHMLGVSSVAFSPDGKRIVGGGWNTVKVWDATSGQETHTLVGYAYGVSSVAFSPDGKRIVGARFDRTLRVWDAVRGQLTLTLRGHNDSISSVAFSPDGARIATGSLDCTVRLWDATNGAEIALLKGHTGPVTSVAYSADGKRIVSGSKDTTVKIWDATSREGTFTLTERGSVNAVAFSSDGKRIASGSGGRTVKVWDLKSGRVALRLNGHVGAITSVAFSPDGRRIVTASDDATIKAWNAEDGRETHTFRGHNGSVSSVAFSPDGNRIVSGSVDSTAKVWNVASAQESLNLTGHTQRVSCVAFSPDGRRIVSGSWDKTIKVWDATNGQEILTFKGHRARVTGVAFSPDGNRIVSGGMDKVLKLWDVTSGQEALTLKGHTGPVWSVAFSADGKRIVSGSGDTTIKVWEVTSGQETLTLQGHSDSVSSLAFSPDGKRIASGSSDKTIKLWDASLGQE